MPKTAMDYSQTIIYKLVCNDLNIKECYIGHTTNWKQRKSNHKQSVENITHKEYNLKKSKFIRENGGWSNWSMIQIELYPCNNKQEAGARERYWFELLGAKLNTNFPSRSQKEYDECHKEAKRNYDIIYRQQTMEKYKIRNSTKYECECGSLSTISNKMRHLKSLKHCQYIDSLLLDKPIGEIILDPCETNELINEN
jgi:hypothetical protein